MVEKISSNNNFIKLAQDENQIDEIKIPNLKSRITLIMSSLTLITMIVIEIYLYVLSLEKCFSSQNSCMNTLKENLPKLSIYIVVSSLIFSIIVFLTIQKKIKVHFFILNTLILIYLFLFHDTGYNFSSHGALNRLIFIILFIIITLVIFIFNGVKNLLQNKNYKPFIFILLISIFTYLVMNYKITNSCRNWDIGINNEEKIDNNSKDYNVCRIKTPKICYVEILDGLFDISFYLRDNCEYREANEKEKLMKYIKNSSESQKYYYPDTTKFSYIDDSNFKKFFFNVMDRTKTSIDKNENQEIEISFDENKLIGKLNINVKRNQTLIDERKIKSQFSTNKDSQIKNIIFIYIDAISRVHFQRKMKKTIQFINENKAFSNYQFMKYHSLDQYTDPNIVPMFYGESKYNKKGTHFLEYIHNQGYISAQTNAICSRELYDLDNDFYENLNYVPFDHENIALFCDPNYFNVENPYPPFSGPYGCRRRCLYGKDTYNYIIEYGLKFWKSYESEKKFLRLGFIDAHEGTSEVVRYLDEPLAMFLNEISKTQFFNETAIIFSSDHGNHMMGVYHYLELEDFMKEKSLGVLIFMIPKYYPMNVEKSLAMEFNKQIMVSAYDVHDTLMDLTGVESKYYTKLGSSLFKKIETIRNCGYYHQDLESDKCRCE